MNRYEITYHDASGNEATHLARAETMDAAVERFNSVTPFLCLSALDLGEDVDNGSPPVIGPA